MATTNPADSTYKKYCPVFFHLDTTRFERKMHGLQEDQGQGAQIMSLAADYCGMEYQVFMHPTCQIDPQVTQQTKFCLKDGRLHYENQEVKEAMTTENGLRDFVNFLANDVVQGPDHAAVLVSPFRYYISFWLF